MSSQFALLGTRRFAPFFATQFLGAFNDNLFKNALIVLLTFQAAAWTTLPPEVLTNIAAGIFILPFFLFSATAGQLADKFDKARLARLVKLLEVLIMGVALLSLVGMLGFVVPQFERLFKDTLVAGISSFARKLRAMSSPLPESYRAIMREWGYPIAPGAVMLLPGNSQELVSMGFTMSTITREARR